MKTTVEVNLPEDFITTSELFNISLKEALETVVKHITVYDFFFAWRTEGIKNMSEKDFVIDVKGRKRDLGID